MSWLRFLIDPPSTPEGIKKRVPPSKIGVYYDTKWSRQPAAKLVRRAGIWGFMKPAMRLYGSPRVIGTDRLKSVKGPVVFVANHHSHADTTLLLTTLPNHLSRDLSVAAGADYFFTNKFMATISALFIGAVPIERLRLSKLSITNTVETIEAGNSLLIFPEGGRSPDGWSQEHRPGAAFVAKLAGVPIVPIYIEGTGNLLPKGKAWPRRSRCAVAFGSPMQLGEGEDVRDFSKRVESRVDELADEFSSGWWEAKKKAHASKTPDLGGPEAGAWRRRWALGPKPGQKRKSPGTKRWPNM